MSAIHPSALRPLLIAAGVAIALALSAPAALAQSKIEQQMSAEQFKAAGLDQLSPEQLANLNAWLNRTLDAETSKAVVKAKEETRELVKHENRGFLGSGSREVVVARLNGKFDGYGQGRVYVLDNGQEWRQVDGVDLPGVHLDSPQVRISPSVIGGAWFLAVDGYNTRAKVTRVK